jgi:hypothetical protein
VIYELTISSLYLILSIYDKNTLKRFFTKVKFDNKNNCIRKLETIILLELKEFIGVKTLINGVRGYG